MPNASQHRAEAAENRTTAEFLFDGGRPRWATTVTFYSAMHLIEYLRALEGIHSENHTERNNYVQANHLGIRVPYLWLYELSRVARYRPGKEFYRRISGVDVRARVLDGFLVTIEAYVAQLDTTRTPPPPGA